MSSRRPILLGIVGDSAAGKSTLTQGLRMILGPEQVTHLCTDDYHRYDRQERAALGITPLAPECNYIDVLEQHLERFHYGQPILKPVYDHATGTLVRPEYLQPAQFVIVEGLLGFSTPTLRQFYDAKVYLAPPEEMRRVWKIKRDTTKRGYTTEQVLVELQRREPDSQKYIRSQRVFSDMIVSFYPPEGVSPERAGPNLNVRLVLRPTIPHPDLSYLLESPNHSDSGVRLLLGRDEGKPCDFLEIDGRRSGSARGSPRTGDLATPARPASRGRRTTGRLPRRPRSSPQLAPGTDATLDRLPPAPQVQRPQPIALRPAGVRAGPLGAGAVGEGRGKAKTGATAGLPSSARACPRDDTAGQASSGTQAEEGESDGWDWDGFATQGEPLLVRS